MSVVSAPRFLIVRFSAIGDCVMAAWTATALRNRHPDAFMCWAVESRCAPVIDRVDLASQVESMPRDRWKKAPWSPATWRSQVARYTSLRRLRFDVGIDLQGHMKTALCLRIAGPKVRLAARAVDGVAARLNPAPDERPPGMHLVEWHAHVLQSLGDYPYPERPIMPCDPKAARLLGERLGDGRPLATIAVSTGRPSKSYPEEGWGEVAQGLIERGYRVAFLGGAADRAVEVADAIDWVGKLDLTSTLEAVRLSAVHLAADTGTGHIAAALGVPVVSIFGPTDPAEYRPYTHRGRTLRQGDRTSSVLPSTVLDAVRELVGR